MHLDVLLQPTVWTVSRYEFWCCLARSSKQCRYLLKCERCLFEHPRHDSADPQHSPLPSASFRCLPFPFVTRRYPFIIIRHRSRYLSFIAPRYLSLPSVTSCYLPSPFSVPVALQCSPLPPVTVRYRPTPSPSPSVVAPLPSVVARYLSFPRVSFRCLPSRTPVFGTCAGFTRDAASAGRRTARAHGV